MNITILGFGREGKSVLKFLKKSPKYRRASIEILDKARNKNYLKNLSRFDLIFRSPGVPYQTSALFRARCDGVKFSSATILFFEAMRNMVRRGSPQVIGITGSKGKGTTATLLYKILKTAKKDVYLVGNIGKSALDILPRLTKNSWVIFELSSFQLQDLPYSPHIAVVLDMFPEHLDHHKTLREYYGSKANIVRFQKPSDIAFYAKDNAVAVRTATKGRGKKIPMDTKSFSLFAPSELRMPGMHNFKNAVAAARVAQFLHISDHTIRKVAIAFRGNEHRLELVRSISSASKSHSNVLKNIRMRFYNDSASTNPHTTIAAIQAFPDTPKILIMGGQDKGLDYRLVAQALRNSGTKLVILVGENKKKIYRQLDVRSSKFDMIFVRNLAEAVRVAYRFARLLTTRYSLLAIIFSPGAASFDMFQNYADRGTQFKKVVGGLTGKKK